MGDSGSRVVVDGLKDLSKALKAAEDGAQKELAALFKDIAAGVVSDVSRRVPRRTGRAAGSYKPRGGATSAAIAFGGPKASYVPWLDFGGSTGRGHVPGKAGSGAVTRPIVKGGRYLYPAITENMKDVEKQVGDAIERLTGKYGFTVDGN